MKYKITTKNGDTVIIDEHKLIDCDGIPIQDMAILKPQRSGLPVAMWFDGNGKNRAMKHNSPRVKIQPRKDNNFSTLDMIPIIVDDNPQIRGKHELSSKDVKTILQFIQRNKDVIIRHYNGEYDDTDLLTKLKY